MSTEQGQQLISEVREATTVEEELNKLEQLDKVLRGNYPLLYRLFNPICSLSNNDSSVPVQIWCCELFRKAFSNSNLPHQIAPVIPKMLNLLTKLLENSDVSVVLKALYCSTSIFPVLFTFVVTHPQVEPTIWSQLESLVQVASAVNIVDSPNLGNNVVKFLQMVILTLTSSDPNKQIAPPDHPNLPKNLPNLALDYFHHLISFANLEGLPYLVATALINSLTTLLLKRPHICGDVITILTTFYHSPPQHFTTFQTQQTLKTIRDQILTVMKQGSKALGEEAALALINLGDSAKVNAHYGSLGLPPPKPAALNKPQSPKRKEAMEFKEAKRPRLAEQPPPPPPEMKRPVPKPMTKPSSPPRPKPMVPPTPSNRNNSVNIDASACPPEIIADLVIHCLKSLTPARIEEAIENARQTKLIEKANSSHSRKVKIDANFATSLLASINKKEEIVTIQPPKAPVVENPVTPVPDPMESPVKVASPQEIKKPASPVEIPAAVVLPPANPTPTDPGQLQVLKLSSDEMATCRLDACQRIMGSQAAYTSGLVPELESGITITWYHIASRLAAMEEDSKDSIMFGTTTVRGLIITFILENPEMYTDLAASWLYEEFLTDLPNSREESSTYTKCVFNLVERYISQIPVKDTWLSGLLLKLPHIPAICLKLIELLCIKPTRHAVGILILREIADSRPSQRMTCLRQVLDFSLNEEKKLRTSAIVSARKWYTECPKLAPHIETFARKALQGLTELLLEPTENADDKQATLKLSQSATAQMELFFALSSCTHSLVLNIFEIYPQVDGVIRAAIEKEIAPLVRSIGPNSSPLLQHLCQFPAGAEDLAYRVLQTLMPSDRTEVNQLKNILEVVKEAVKADALSIRFMIPILPFVDESEIAEFIPLVLNSIAKDGTQHAKDFFIKLASPWGPPPPLPPAPPAQLYGLAAAPPPQQLPTPPLMKPGKILLLLHCKDFDNQRTLVIKAVSLCIAEVALFPASEIVEALQQMIDTKKIPVLTMRTTIEFIRTHAAGPVVGRIVPQLLLRLVQKNVWHQPMLWEGFIRVCNMLGTASHSILLKLPAPELEYAMNKFPTLKEALTTRVRAHLAQNPSLALQMAHLLPLFTEPEKDASPPPPSTDPEGKASPPPDASSDPGPDLIYATDLPPPHHSSPSHHSPVGSSQPGSRQISPSPPA